MVSYWVSQCSKWWKREIISMQVVQQASPHSYLQALHLLQEYLPHLEAQAAKTKEDISPSLTALAFPYCSLSCPEPSLPQNINADEPPVSKGTTSWHAQSGVQNLSNVEVDLANKGLWKLPHGTAQASEAAIGLLVLSHVAFLLSPCSAVYTMGRWENWQRYWLKSPIWNISISAGKMLCSIKPR